MPLPTDALQPIGALLANLIPKNLSKKTGECAEHGEFTALTREGLAPACPQCMLEREARERTERDTTARRASLRAAAHLPRRYHDSALKGYPIQYQSQAAVVNHIRHYVVNIHANVAEGRGLIFSGGTGTGKTRLACALANNAMYHLVSVRYTTMAEMIAEVRSTYNGARPGVTEAMAVARFITGCDLLILDEIDIFKTDSQADMNLIYRIVDGRYQERRPIIALTNQIADGLDAFLGDRAAGRVRENSLVLSFDWPDYRQVAA